MKKLVLAGLVAASVLNATEVTLSCRTSGFVDYKSEVVMSMDCGGMGSSECENSFKEKLKRQYNETNDYDAQEDVCNKMSGSWYPDAIRIRY